MKILKKLIGITVVLSIMATTVAFAQETQPANEDIRRRTQWISESIYGIDGISPPLDIDFAGKKPGEKWDDTMRRFDVDAMVNEAVESGAEFLTFTLGWGYFTIPFDPYEEFLGLAPGEATSTRDLLEEVYQKASKHGIKILVYATGDAAVRRPDLQAKLGWNGGTTPEFRERWFGMLKWVSDKYGKKIDGWWVDGAYDVIGYTDEILEEFAVALRSGNPDSVICFNNGLGANAFDYRAGADFTAGEVYGMQVKPEGRFKNGLQWMAFMPMSFQYGQISSAYSTKKVVDYVGSVHEKGGATYLWVADKTMDLKQSGGYTNKIQLDQLKVLKSVYRDKIPYDPYAAFSKPYENIEAEDCIDMKGTPDLTGRQMTGGLLYSIGEEGSFYQSNVKNTWTKFDKIKLPKGAKKINANVRSSDKWLYSESWTWKPLEKTTMEVKVGGVNGEVIATFDGINEFDNFSFSSDDTDPPLRDGIADFKTVSKDINLAPGEYDICITFKGNGPHDYITEARTIEEEIFEVAKYAKEPWIYNKCLSTAYNSLDKDYQKYLFDKIDEIKPNVDFRTTPIKATQKLYARDFSERRPNAYDELGKHLDIVKEEGSSPEGEYMIYLLQDDWIMFKDVDFSEGADKFTTSFIVGPGYGGSNIDIYIDDMEKPSSKIGSLTIEESNNWSNFTEQSCPVKFTSGIHDVYLKFNVKNTTCGNLEYIRFNAIPFDITSKTTYSQNGVAIDKLKKGAVDVSVAITNKQGKARNINLITALYSKADKRLVDVSSKNVFVLEDAKDVKSTATLNIGENPDDYEVKVYAKNNDIPLDEYNFVELK